MINKKRLIKLTQDLIRIDSQNPVADEVAIAGFVRNYLRALGVSVKLYEFKKRRPNVIATIGQGPYQLLISPHLDTVPAGAQWKKPPFAATIQGGRIYGLGATDCKSNIAVALEVIRSLLEEKRELRYNLIFAATADEESGSELGLIPLLKKKILHPDAALILDADDFRIVIAQKGLVHVKVKIRGKRAHGAYPWLGVNAINKALAVLQDLARLEFRNPANRYLRPPTMNIGTIRGGDKVNVVADWCEFELDFRFLPGQTAQEVLRRLKAIAHRHTRHFTIEVEGIQKPYCISPGHALVKHLTQAMRSYKINARMKGSEGATVITFFQDQGIPAIATGFGCEGCAHAADEYVTIGNLYKGARVLEDFLLRFAPETMKPAR
jgi:succinyl-diaminopimelate desuccinylase